MNGRDYAKPTPWSQVIHEKVNWQRSFLPFTEVKFHGSVHKTPMLAPTLSQMNTAHLLPHYFHRHTNKQISPSFDILPTN